MTHLQQGASSTQAAGRPWRAFWPGVEKRWLSDEQILISVPLFGSPTPPDFGYQLSSLLTQRWVRRPFSPTVSVQSLAAHVGQNDGRRTLVLLMTLAPDSGRHLSGSELASGVKTALATLSHLPHAAVAA
jgi:hypothetical protein